MIGRSIFLSAALICLLAGRPAAADESDDWFDKAFDPSAGRVNEGRLVFLERLPDKPVHIQHNHVVIGDESLASGWVDLVQCHEALDAVPRSQVVFHRERSRDLRVTEARGIGAVWVEGNTVQLKDTARGARLCIAVESRALEWGGDGFHLRNGPFMRRFLDGYYPMHVTTRVTVATAGLRFAGITPEIQPGFRVWQAENDVFFDAQFEGRLNTDLLFHGPGR